MLSIIVPIYNDLDDGWIQQILARLDELGEEGVEIVCVDSSTLTPVSVGTNEARSPLHGRKVIKYSTSSRGERLQEGINASVGDIILLHHPRSVIDLDGLRWLRDQAIDNKIGAVSWHWGGFQHEFDYKHWLLRFTSWYSNVVRPFTSAVVYLDHCIFFKRKALGTDTIPAVEIFEDTLLSRMLYKSTGTRPFIAPFTSVTSAIRFTTNGIWKQAVMNQWLKVKYFVGGLGKDGSDMNRDYERGLNLNGSVLLEKDAELTDKKKNQMTNTTRDIHEGTPQRRIRTHWIFSLWLILISASHALGFANMLIKDCDLELEVGVEMMGLPVAANMERHIELFPLRDDQNPAITNASVLQAGAGQEFLIKLNPSTNQCMFEVGGGGAFLEKGYDCGGGRSRAPCGSSKGTILVLDPDWDDLSEPVRIAAGWSKSFKQGVQKSGEYVLYRREIEQIEAQPEL